jgi:hypothetical protein
MRHSSHAASILVAATIGLLATAANAQEYHARLSGFNEVGGLNAETGAILTNGRGALDLVLNRNALSATYTLTYSDLTSPVLQAHIHFGKVHTPGGIFVFLCTNLAPPPGVPTPPACPSAAGTVTGTMTAANIIAVAGQNITAGDFNVLVEALGSDTAYANVHTNNFKAGEIRGQVRHIGENENEK